MPDQRLASLELTLLWKIADIDLLEVDGWLLLVHCWEGNQVLITCLSDALRQLTDEV